MKWVKKCPCCGKQHVYSRLRKEREHTLCKSCKKTQYYQKLRNSDPRKEIIGETLWFYRICPKCGEKVFYKQIGHRNYMEKQGKQCRKCFQLNCFIYPNFNKKACELFDALNHIRGWNGRHALNGGEFYIERFHYFLDYYEPTINLVIEWDEFHHKYRKDEDARRRNNIKQVLKCRLIVINETTKLEDIKV